MKRIISISLLCLFISNSLFKAALIFNYWQNKQEIIADCCINKNKPELNCDGKCYVDKELNKINTNSKADLPSKVIEKDFELFLTAILQYEVKFYINSHSVCKDIQKLYDYEYASELFQPPTA